MLTAYESPGLVLDPKLDVLEGGERGLSNRQCLAIKCEDPYDEGRSSLRTLKARSNRK